MELPGAPEAGAAAPESGAPAAPDAEGFTGRAAAPQPLPAEAPTEAGVFPARPLHATALSEEMSLLTARGFVALGSCSSAALDAPHCDAALAGAAGAATVPVRTPTGTRDAGGVAIGVTWGGPVRTVLLLPSTT
jgi:hypothetical protein